MRFIIYSIFTFCVSFVAYSDKYLDMTAKSRAIEANFIGLVKIVNGRLSESNKREYYYTMQIEDVIKSSENKKGDTLSFVSRCGLAFSTSYLIYGYKISDSEIFVSDCVDGVLFEVLNEYPNFELQVMFPDYLKKNLPIMNLKVHDACQLTVNKKCVTGEISRLVNYHELKANIIKKLGN